MTETDHSEPDQPPADEAFLWPRAAGGDLEAAEELARETYRAVFAALVRLCGGDRELAADLTQETYRKAWRSIGSFHGGSRFSTWLYRIAYNTFLNHIRRPRPMVALEETQIDRLTEPAEDQHAALERSRTDEQVRRAVLRLPEELRFAVTARFWGEVPVKEIARLQGISRVGVQKRLQRAFRELAPLLEEVSP